jgi:hypothetical protein
VPEAREAKGKLYGFERTSDLIARAKTADAIVAQARYSDRKMTSRWCK